MVPSAPTRAELKDHLVAHRIAGRVATPRENNLTNFKRLSQRQPHWMFGMTFHGEWTPNDVLTLMAKKVGVNPDEGYRFGVDTIDPELTLDAIEAMADRLRRAAEQREPLLFATGHPAGLLPMYQDLARVLSDHGCPLLTPAEGWTYVANVGGGPQPRHIRYLDEVATLYAAGGLAHTHSPKPMRAIIDELDRTGGPRPVLVIADHGWAGAAGEAGIDVVGFADSNDPALFVGEAEGKIQVAVPLDDNVLPVFYAPVTTYVIHYAGL